MGGSSKLSYCSKCKEPLNCDICTYKGHRSALCPFLYTECPAVGCKSYRKIIKSSATENPDRLFLKCQSPKCGSFQWLDEAVDKCYSPGSSSKSLKPHRNSCCFKCGEPDHWVHDCPWAYLGCQEKDCTGVLTISKSSASAYVEFRLRKCDCCKTVIPFSEAKMAREKHSSSSICSPKTLHKLYMKLDTTFL